MKAFTVGLYSVMGGLALAAGVAILVMPSLLLSPAEYDRPDAASAPGGGGAVCLPRSDVFLVPLHYDQRRPVHLALLVFIVLFAGVHWNDYLSSEWRRR